MSHPDSPSAGSWRPRHWMLWLHVSGLMLIAGFLVFMVSLPGLADEDQRSGPGATVYFLLALIVAGLMSRIYIVVRRAEFSRLRALAVAVVAIPATYVLAFAFLFGIVFLF